MLGGDSLNVDSDRDMCMGSSCESPRPPCSQPERRAPSAGAEFVRMMSTPAVQIPSGIGGWRLTAGGGDLEQLEVRSHGFRRDREGLSRGNVHACARHRSLYGKLTKLTLFPLSRG